MKCPGRDRPPRSHRSGGDLRLVLDAALSPIALAASLTFCLLAISGCKGEADSLDNANQSAKQSGQNDPSGTTPGTEASGRTRPADAEESPDDGSGNGFDVTTDTEGRKWLTSQIPYDVYQGLPSATELIAANARAGGGPAVIEPMETAADSETAAESGAAEPASEPPGSAVASADPTPESMAEEADSSEIDFATANWDEILPEALFDDEISHVRNRLHKALLTVANYNTSIEQVVRDGALMAALATIASEHPGSLSWKDNALLARDAAAVFSNAATGGGRERFQKAQIAIEQVSAILNNNVPARMDPPKTDRPRPETASRAALMRRIEAAHKRLQELGKSDSSFRQHLDELDRESRMMAALAKFVAHPDYEGAGNDDYQAAAKDLFQSGLAISQAAGDEDFAKFQSTLQGTSAACAACHQKYR